MMISNTKNSHQGTPGRCETYGGLVVVCWFSHILVSKFAVRTGGAVGALHQGAPINVSYQKYFLHCFYSYLLP